MDSLFNLGLAGGVGLLVIIALMMKRNPNRPLLRFPPLTVTDIAGHILYNRRIRGDYRDHTIQVKPVRKKSTSVTQITLDAGPTRELSPPPDQFTPADLPHFLSSTLPNEPLTGDLYIVAHGQRLIYEQKDLKPEVATLAPLLDCLVDLLEGYPAAVALGSDLIPTLHAVGSNVGHPLQLAAPHLLRDIELSTTARLGQHPEQFVCIRCWTRCASRKYRLDSLRHIRYYGCRACGQSREVDLWPREMVAILDSDLAERQVRHKEVLWVNWLIHRAVFDFDRVWINRATDEDVERLVVQVGNDTDPMRQPKYGLMTCTVATTCDLSPATLRLLARTFGQVERRVVSGAVPTTNF